MREIIQLRLSQPERTHRCNLYRTTIETDIMRLHTLPIRTIAALLLTCGAASATPTGKTGFIRTTASTPEQLLEQIYNTALIGNDRLADIENYMSRGLKADYKLSLIHI